MDDLWTLVHVLIYMSKILVKVEAKLLWFWIELLVGAVQTISFPIWCGKTHTKKKSFIVFFLSLLLILVSFFIYIRKFGLTYRVQIALTHFAPLLFHLVSLCFNLWKHLFWDGLALGDSFGPGIAHITAILNLTKPDWSKRTFGLAEIGYSSSSISLRPGLDGGKGNYSCWAEKLVWKSEMLLNKTRDLNGIITAISGANKASWLVEMQNKHIQLLWTFYISHDLDDWGH